MAKLNITFVDELGNNLNRYRAIDINTNEEFIFDLSRDGTITTPGTPLNAERLNAIVNAINSMDTEKQSQIDTLKNETKELREDFDNSFTEKSVTRKIRKLVDYPSKEISYPDQNVTLKQLGGMSYKYNQLGSLSQNIISLYSSTIENNMFHIPSANTWGSGVIRTNDNVLINSHKYYVSALVKSTSSSMIVNSTNTYGFITNSNISSTVFTKIDGIVNIKADSERIYFINNGTDGVEYYIQPMIVDLTAMYGAGNEPTTVEQFLSDYPMYNDYVEYTEGNIINAAVSSVDSVGANIWDEEYVNAYINENGIPANSSNDFASKNYIKVMPNTELFYRIPSTNYKGFGIYYYDINYNFISTTWVSQQGTRKYTTPNNCYYMKFYVNYLTYNNDICINVSNDSFNGTYLPYVHNNYPIPSSIQSLEGYGWGINESCYNYIDFENKKFVKKVGRVDLGTLDWTYYEGYDGFYAITNDIKPVQNGIGNMIVNGFTNVTDTYFNTYTSEDKLISKNATTFLKIRVIGLTTSEEIKNYLSGVYLYYELATPVETDIVALNNYPVWQYGTETQNAILPAIMIKEYSISTLDQIVKNIEVDANQTDMIEKLVEKDLSIDNSIKDITNQQTNHSSAISDLSDRVVDLELYKIDKSKLTIEQNLIKTKLLYDGVVISEVNSADVMVTPKIYISVEQVSDSSFNEILKVENDTNYDMDVSMNGQGTHSKFNVPSGLTKTSSKTISIGASGIPENYTSNIELEVYFNSNRTYNNTVGSTLVKNKKIINLVADVTTTDK